MTTATSDKGKEVKGTPTVKKGGNSSIFFWLSIVLLGITYLIYEFELFSAKSATEGLDKSEPLSFFSYEINDIYGKPMKLNQFKDKVVLAVNVASECGFASQYKGLQQLYKEYKDKDFVVIAFPSDQFEQELGTDEEIIKFAQSKYSVTFPMSSKITLNGPDAHPVYKYLTSQKPGALGMTRINWNFEKFLINREGIPIFRYSSITGPKKFKKDIESLL